MILYRPQTLSFTKVFSCHLAFHVLVLLLLLLSGASSSSSSSFPSSFSQSCLDDGSRVSSSQRADKEFKRFREFAPRTPRLIDFFSFPTLTLLVLTGFAPLRLNQKTYPPFFPLPLPLSCDYLSSGFDDRVHDSIFRTTFNFYIVIIYR